MRKRLLSGVLAAALVVVFLCAWYVITRMRSAGNAVSVVELEDVLPAAEAGWPLRIGCYNIAHGRGGKFDRSSWEGGSRKEKKERVTQMARLIREQKLGVVVLNEVDFNAVWSGGVNQAQLIAGGCRD